MMGGGPQGVRHGGRVNINECSKHELLAIPGVGEDVAESIVRFREQHGRIDSEGQLKQLDTVNDEMLKRIKREVVFH
jgi:competence protein ComEA